MARRPETATLDADRTALSALRTEVEREREAVAAERRRLRRLREAMVKRWKARLLMAKQGQAVSAAILELRDGLTRERAELDELRKVLVERERRLDAKALREGLAELERRHESLEVEVATLGRRADRLRAVVANLHNRRTQAEVDEPPFADVIAEPEVAIAPPALGEEVIDFVRAATAAGEWWRSQVEAVSAEFDDVRRSLGEWEAHQGRGRSKAA